MNGKTIKRTFLEADSEGLALLLGGKTATKVPKAEIRSVGRKDRVRGALIGMIAGGAAGGGLGTLGSYVCCTEGYARAIAAVGLTGAGIGAGIGAAIAKEIKLYETTALQER